MRAHSARGTLRHAGAYVMLAVFAGACDVFELDDTLYERTIGAVHSVEVPQTAVAGAAFRVQIITLGGGCTRAADTRVSISANPPAAELTPYVFEAVRFPPYTSCTDEQTSQLHDVVLTFDTPGQARITVHGRNGTARVHTVAIAPGP